MKQRRRHRTRLTPDVKNAIAILREKYKQAQAKYAHATQVLCYDRLHHVRSHNHDTCENVVSLWLNKNAKMADRFLVKLKESETQTPHRCFKLHFDCLSEMVGEAATELTTGLIEVGDKLEVDKVVTDGVAWGEEQAKRFVGDSRDLINTWVREACDGEGVDAQSWRAPMFLLLAKQERLQ